LRTELQQLLHIDMF